MSKYIYIFKICNISAADEAPEVTYSLIEMKSFRKDSESHLYTIYSLRK